MNFFFETKVQKLTFAWQIRLRAINPVSILKFKQTRGVFVLRNIAILVGFSLLSACATSDKLGTRNPAQSNQTPIFVGDKLSCVIHKFKQTFNISKDDDITERFEIDGSQTALIDKNGKMKLLDTSTPPSPALLKDYILINANNLSSLVIVSMVSGKPNSQFIAEGNNGATLVNVEKETALTCGLK
jgi:hypothetical protein